MTSDAELLRRHAQTNEPAAFTALVQRHLPMVYRAAWRQLAGDSHAAEDVAQGVFSLLARKVATLRNHPNLAGWLHTATRHLARDHRRAAARRAAREREAALMNESDGTEAAVNWDRLQPILDEALGSLRDADRDAILLRHFQGLNLAAVGAALGVSEDAARVRINRALERLRDILARRGLKSTAAALGVALTAESAQAAPAAALGTIIASTALTDAAVVAGGAVWWPWFFMNTFKMAAAGVVALTAVGWATWENARYEAALRAAVQAEAAPLPSPSVPPATVFPPPTIATPRRATPPVAARPTPSEQDAAEALARGDLFLSTHPEARLAAIEAHRASIAAEYAPFYAERHLSAAQRNAFEEIMRQSASRSLGYPEMEGRKAITLRLPKEFPTDERDFRLRAALGSEEMAALAAYRQERAGARDVRVVAGLTADSERPMNTAQARALRTILTTPSANARQGLAYWDEVISRATPLLPAEQLEVLAMMRAREELRLADAEAAKAEIRNPARKG